MHFNFLKYLVPFLAGLIISTGLKAQIDLSTYFDLGTTSVSDGIFVRNAGFIGYEIKKINITGGYQFDLKSAGTNFFSGTSLNVSYDFSIKKFPLRVRGLFLYNPFSGLVHETNWGFLAGIMPKHFVVELGTNFRTYKVTQKAVDDYDIDPDEKIHENWNLMYLLQYTVKPADHPWNTGLAVTNFDHFLISQETNPAVYLLGSYDIKAPLRLYAEVWYKSAGSFNLASNYFGYFFRTGLIWKWDLRK